jgi:hypothetical protein
MPDLPHIFISKFDNNDLDACITDHLSYPESGSHLEIPAGTFKATEYDLPRTEIKITDANGVVRSRFDPILPGEDGYMYGMNADRVKNYVNEQAVTMALSMLECVFSNPYTEVICYGDDDVTLCYTD